MDAYIFQAAMLCDECGKSVIRNLRKQGVKDTGDSDDFPQGPYSDGGGEADCPQHCDHCGEFLENPLTSDGAAYVREQLANRTIGGRALEEWRDFDDWL